MCVNPYKRLSNSRSLTTKNTSHRPHLCPPPLSRGNQILLFQLFLLSLFLNTSLMLLFLSSSPSYVIYWLLIGEDKI